MKKLLFMACVLIMFSVFVQQPAAEMYKWVDKNGVIHFSDTPPKSEKDVEIYETSNSPQPNETKALKRSKKKEAKSKQQDKAKPAKTVKIYTTKWCRYCKDAIRFLRANNIKYKEYDIEKDSGASMIMQALGGTGVPFAVINGRHIHGFSKRQYKRALGLK